ncbi:hypothetical protein [Paraburkholderia sp.]|jgi:hypothetical protein|uniref:hypothetical protein n=1 Tax=Paraburkholderia sp. TaxID=1926495 RepID=UPI002F3F423F
MFGLGSRSAQTPSESSQNSDAGGGLFPSEIAGSIQALVNDGISCNVHHMWRKVSAGAIPHHSQIFVSNRANGILVLNFGLWMGENGTVEFATDEDKNVRWYTQSDTYSPNPVAVMPRQLQKAFLSTRLMCGPDYKLLHNNCQKFARLFMTELGASHNRSLFHP